MLRTIIACAGFIILALGTAHWLTQDFEFWTAEGARRFDVAASAVATPDVAAVGPWLAASNLPDTLTNTGGVTIVNFIYTTCQTICQVLGTEFQDLQARIEADNRLRERVRLVSISFDPAHDTISVLRDYAGHLGANPDVWTFVTVPDDQQLRQLLSQFNVVVIPDGNGGYAHNAALLIVDGRARLVRIFDYADVDLALGYATRLAERQLSG
ncbi:MAG: SCO family protein [Gammaproteobacteria bacterium]